MTDPPPPRADDALFTGRFFVMCSFTFTVFCSLFMLVPTMPYRILALGGTEGVAGLFLGALTYSSALSAPFTGALADRLGKRRILVASSLGIAGFSTAYALSPTWHLPLALALLHGVLWSALLGASSAYLVDIVPPHRRAEGIGYWGLSTMFALAVAPGLGFRLNEHGWWAVCGTVVVLNLAMALIASRLQHERRVLHMGTGGWVEWHILVLSGCLLLYSFGYGAITSFVGLYADAHGVRPRSLFFTVFAVVVVLTRPWSAPLADRIGHRKVLLPALVLIVAGLSLLATVPTRAGLVAAALVFGGGFGTAYTVFAAHVLQHVDEGRRGAAFGSMLAAFDVGIGTGSIGAGWIAERYGLSAAFGFAAALSALSLPWFLAFDRRMLGAVARERR